jgi:alpha-tubulin suppressor-like RCC1 family protein
MNHDESLLTVTDDDDRESDYLFVVGNNSHGELGVGHQRKVSLPLRVRVARRVLKVATGWDHTAMIVLNGDLFMWGSNRW